MLDTAQRKRVLWDGIALGFGPMVPLVAAAVGAWLFPDAVGRLAERLAIIWGALILAFVAGVRRGYGFGNRTASKRSEILSMIAYFTLAGLSLLSEGRHPVAAISMLLVGFALVMSLDTRAAWQGDAPGFFARLRPSQMGIAVYSFAALDARLLL